VTYPSLFLFLFQKGLPVDPFTEVAKRFFVEFLELKVALEQQGAMTPDEQTKMRKHYEKEVERWKKANEELKISARNLAADNKLLGAEVENLTGENEKLRLQLNEAIMRLEALRARHKLPRDDSHEYPLTEHMSDRARKEWERMLKGIPYAGNKEIDDDA